MSRSAQTFIAACLAGAALLEDVDDWVDAWHQQADDDMSLDEFLGFTPDEGALWSERSEALRFVVAAHRYNRPVADLLQSRDQYALAARGGADEDAEQVLTWLRETGRLAQETA